MCAGSTKINCNIVHKEKEKNRSIAKHNQLAIAINFKTTGHPKTRCKKESKVDRLKFNSHFRLAGELVEPQTLDFSQHPSTMKTISHLPPSYFYKKITSEKKGIFLFEDLSSKALKIQSPIENPFGQEWTILYSQQKQKSDTSVFPYRLILRLYPVDRTLTPAIILREKIKGVFASSNRSTLAFYAFPIDIKSIPIWLLYSVIEK